ncbi:hypothetical protein P691DRAFT_802968 [Macrolepiota fuliginosa MF-IS2]|uniref:F-box domain-containing protein n=1 Tax=Macrolepiota fuliginosa MF-IS2 TaxID=1400762 RepID=A0A9P6C0Y8_9AGAR|nr:hypothetical protein P691DRAFT_802968 [Macrolepiota fuliginosa MF-IS2]
MLNDTPYDILSVVTQYLPVPDVEKLSGVSRRLRSAVGLDARFGGVRFYKHDSGMKRLCEILGRNDVANSVRRLTIEPWLVQPRTKGYVSRSENIWNHINALFNPKYMEQQAQRRVQKRVNKDIKRVSNAIQRLENLQEYHVLYDERSPTYHRQLFEAFLSPTLNTFAPKLTKLTIKVPFELLPHLSYVQLPQLLDLDVYLCTGNAQMEDIKQALDGFWVFLHNLRALEHLGVSATSSSHYLDLSYFSKRWGTFPHLKSFGLCIPFDGGLLSSPEDLYKHVLEPHAGTLEKLRLSTTCCAVPRGSLPPDCHFWIQRILKSSLDTRFPRLREVELALRPLKANLVDLHTFLALRAPTLEKLCLTDRALYYKELTELFDCLCPPSALPRRQNDVLENLCIKVDTLSAESLALIAARFPGLKTLGLTFADIVGGGSEPARYNKQKLTSFAQSLRRYSTAAFATWGLRNIKICEGPPSFPWIRDLEKIFLECFPPPLSVGEFPPLAK